MKQPLVAETDHNQDTVMEMRFVKSWRDPLVGRYGELREEEEDLESGASEDHADEFEIDEARVDQMLQCQCIAGLLWCTMVPVLVGLVIFLPWYCVGIQPNYEMLERMRESHCTILNHTVVSVKPTKDNSNLMYVPGLAVTFVDSDGHGGATTTVQAVARPRLKERQSWMGWDVMQNYYSRYPVNSTHECYYDTSHPSDMVVMVGGVDNLGQELALSIFVAILSMIGSTPLALMLLIPICSVVKCLASSWIMGRRKRSR
ncbi:hypothetical protein [Mollivirus kamchatka]|nr:hypothetical protein [Mollivirus kamchatka]